LILPLAFAWQPFGILPFTVFGKTMQTFASLTTNCTATVLPTCTFLATSWVFPIGYLKKKLASMRCSSTPTRVCERAKLHHSNRLFAGDIDPADGMCDNKPTMVGSVKMANAVIGATATMTPTTNVQLKAYTHVVDFGPTNLNATLGRFD